MVYTDDTDWKVGEEPAHLMAFDTDEVTVYQVRPRHRHREVQEVVPADYKGVMVTDGAAAMKLTPLEGSSSRSAWPISRKP